MHSTMTWFVLLVAAFAVSEADVIRERRNDETIIVTTIEEEPYLKIDNSASGNDKFTGFIPDLMKKIAKEKNINYQFRLVGDKAYGFEENGRWNGMIGELIDGTAHLAAAPLTLSEKRQKVVKFTEPFMDIGTAMLAKKPESGDPPVNSFKELSEQTDVKYGVVKSGFTMQFFEGSSDPVYSKIWQYMNSHRQTSMLNGNGDGVEKVRAGNGKYIFIMENSTAAFWMNQEPCDLLVVGKPISDRQYGFATHNNKGALNDKVSDAIRKLKESGELAKLERHWWRKDAQCDGASASHATGFLTLALGALSFVLTRY